MLPLYAILDEVFDENFCATVPALLRLVATSDRAIIQLVNGAFVADIDSAAGHHVGVGEGETAHPAEELIGA